LQLLQTSASVGLYAALYQLGFYPIVLLTALWMVLIQPVMFGRAGAGTDPVRSAHGRRLGIILVVVTLLATVAATGAAALFSDRIFALLVAPDYRGVSFLLPLMILGSGFFACGQVVSLIGMINPDTSRLIAPKVGASIIGTLANFVGAWRYGVDGVVYAGVLYGVIYFAWMTKAIAITPAKRAALAPVSAR
jgi:O-antigen/teichoic acid export membrane protein